MSIFNDKILKSVAAEALKVLEQTEPKNEKEKKLASLAHPKDKITQKDVLVGRGVLKKEQAEQVGESVFDYKSAGTRKVTGATTRTGHDVVKRASGTVYTKRAREDKPEDAEPKSRKKQKVGSSSDLMSDEEFRKKHGMSRKNYERMQAGTKIGESFTDLLEQYTKYGLKSISQMRVNEEPDNEQFKKELEGQKKKASEKKTPEDEARVAKPFVQSVKMEEVKQLDERSDRDEPYDHGEDPLKNRQEYARMHRKPGMVYKKTYPGDKVGMSKSYAYDISRTGPKKGKLPEEVDHLEEATRVIAKHGDVEVHAHRGDDEGYMVDVRKNGKKVAQGDHDSYAGTTFISHPSFGKGQRGFRSHEELAKHFSTMKEEVEQLEEDPLALRSLYSTDPNKQRLLKTQKGREAAAKRNVPELKNKIKSAMQYGRHVKPNLPEQFEDDFDLDEAAKWRQGYRASGHPAGFKHKSGEVGPIGGTYDLEHQYDDDKKVPVQKHRDYEDPLKNRADTKMAQSGRPLTTKNAQKNLKSAILQSKGKHGPVGKLPEQFEDDFDLDEAAMSHQAKTTMKHIKNPTSGEKQAAKDIKPGIAGYRDRIAMLKSAEARGALNKEEVKVTQLPPGPAPTGRWGKGLSRPRFQKGDGPQTTRNTGDDNYTDRRMRDAENRGTLDNREYGRRMPKLKEEHLEEGRLSQRHPLEGHEYHKKSDAELVYIAKDAHKAAEAMKSHNTQAENKYRDQANDSATVRHFRQKSGMPDWYKKKYGHMKEETDTTEKIEMVQSQLHFIKYACEEILEYIKMGGEVEEWYQVKVAKAFSEFESLHAYIEGEKRRLGMIKEDLEYLEEKNKPTNPELWSRAISMAKQKFDVYPSAYANGWAAKWYKSKGGNWESVNESSHENKPPFDGPYKKVKDTVTDKSGAKHSPYSRVRDLARKAMQKQMKTPVKESIEESRKAEIVKELVKKKKSKNEIDKFEKEPILSDTISKQ